MLDLVQYNPNNQISPLTRFKAGNFREIPEFHSTIFSRYDDAGKLQELLVPMSYLPLLVERNTRIFAQKVSSL